MIFAGVVDFKIGKFRLKIDFAMKKKAESGFFRKHDSYWEKKTVIVENSNKNKGDLKSMCFWLIGCFEFKTRNIGWFILFSFKNVNLKNLYSIKI